MNYLDKEAEFLTKFIEKNPNLVRRLEKDQNSQNFSSYRRIQSELIYRVKLVHPTNRIYILSNMNYTQMFNFEKEIFCAFDDFLHSQFSKSFPHFVYNYSDDFSGLLSPTDFGFLVQFNNSYLHSVIKKYKQFGLNFELVPKEKHVVVNPNILKSIEHMDERLANFYSREFQRGVNEMLGYFLYIAE